MEQVFICYTTDTWHSYASRDVIGIAIDLKTAISICKQQAKKDGFKIKGDALFELNNLKQTQSYKGSGEFVIEEITTNTLL